MLNQCQFIGNLGKDPEIRTTQSGNKVASFSVAVTEKWKSKGGEMQERTEWVNVVVWSEGLVGVVEKYLSKGSKVFISGKMQTRKWEKDGVDRYTTEIVLQGFDAKMIMLGAKNDDAPKQKSAGTYAPIDDLEDEIPWN